MAQARCVTIIGDSNSKRHMSENNIRGRPLMSGAQVVQCGRMPLFSEALKSLRVESDVCIISCITNFLTSAKGSSAVSLRVEPVISDFLAKITEVADSKPEVRFLICPPMFRHQPIWYREALPEVLQKFSDLCKRKPVNCHMMPSFPTPTFETDGVHLTAYSGHEFVLHMFESMDQVLSRLEMPPSDLSLVISESTRVREDRVMVLEQDHRRLNSQFELKTAVDAELSDFQENIRNESFFIIQGLPRLPKLEPKEWQAQAKVAVQEVLKSVMGKEYPIVFIQNSTGRGKEARTTYRVKMPSVVLSREIRDKFGLFFMGSGGDKRPDDLKGISIRNAVTTATLARITILQLFGKRYNASNPGSTVKVLGFDSRPLLKIFPSAEASDKRVQTYNFIEAVSKLPANFTSSEIDDLLKRISPKLHGNLKPLLVVLSDDMVKKKIFSAKPPSKATKASKSKATKTSTGGSGSESSTSFKSPGDRGGPSRTSVKRGATVSPGGPAAKK